MGNSTSNIAEDHTDQIIYVGSPVDLPTSQNVVNSDESSCDFKKSSLLQLEGESMSQEKTVKMSESYDASINSNKKNEILEALLHTSTEEKSVMSPYEDVSENMETLKEKKGDCSSINAFWKENNTDGVPIAFESKDSLSGASVESTLQKGERHVENHLEYSCCKVESRSCIEESIPPNQQTKNAILQMVQRCNESLENLEKDHQVIFNVMNSRSNCQSELKDKGLKVTTELEYIVEKLTARQKEKDDTISELQFILSKLTEKVDQLDQEIQVLKSTRKNESESVLQSKELEGPVAFMVDGISHVTSVPKAKIQKTAMQDSKRLVHRNEEALTSLNPFPLKPSSKPAIEEKSFSSENIVFDHASNETDQGNEEMSLCHSKNNPETNSFGSHDENQLKKNNVNTSSSLASGVRINDSESKVSVTFEQNIGEQDREGQQKSTFKELDSLNIRENSTRQLFDASNTLDTNVINSQNDSKNWPQKEILHDGYWVDQVNEICRMISIEGPLDNVCGQCNVLCLDTSDSMSGEAFQTMINLSIRFVSGLEHSSLNQKVGLVCFGGYTGVISRCCVDYEKLKQEIKNLRPGGSSPLSAGILLSWAVLYQVTLPTIQGIMFFPRIIVLTDGIATPETVTGCGDFTPDMQERLKIRANIDGLTKTIRQSANRVYCVPLGKADESFIEPLSRRTHGKIVRPANFDKLIYQYEGEVIATQLRPYFPNFRHVEPDMVMAAVQSFNFSMRGVDMEDLVEYIQNPPPQREEDSDDEDDNDDHTETDINMPPIGTRVRRGPDWESNFGEQDSRGPGTVVSHDRSGVISIMWDNGHQYLYPYGVQGRFAVMVVDEPRILQRDQLIEVGCLVKRGNNWRDHDNDGGPENIGVVFRVHSDATVGVRWPTGQRRRYKYGKQGYFEVQLCDPFDESVQFRMLSLSFQDCPDENTTSHSRQADSEEVRIEDLVNSDDRETDPLEEMNKRNAMRSTQTSGQSGPDTNHRQSRGSADHIGRVYTQGNQTLP